MSDLQDAVNALHGKTVWITASPEFRAFHKFRDLNDKRPHVPLVKWDGTEWVMSVFDPHMFPRVRTTHSWSEALGWALIWARINHGAGLL